MKCPHCFLKVSYDSATCPHCRFDLDDAREEFGFQNFTFRRLAHPEGFFTAKELKAMGKQMDKLEERFPEVLFGSFFVDLMEQNSLEEFAFWMQNHCNVGKDQKRRSLEDSAFLIMDIRSREICFALGYRLERVIPQTDLHQCLRRGEMFFCESDFTKGTQKVWERFAKQLAERIASGALVPRGWIETETSPQPVFEPEVAWGPGLNPAYDLNSKQAA